MRITKWRVLGGLLLIFIAWSMFMYNFFWGMLPGGTGILATAETSDGVQMYLYQEYNYFIEPYSVHFYYVLPDQGWRDFFIDFEADRWHDCEIKIDEEEHIAKIYNNGSLELTIDWTKDLERRRFQQPNLMPKEWTPHWNPKD